MERWPTQDSGYFGLVETLTSDSATDATIWPPSQPREPLMPPSNPDFLFQKTATDLFDLHGKYYIVYADRYTGRIEIAPLPSGNMQQVKELVLHIQCTEGDTIRWRATIWFIGVQFIFGRLGHKETHIILVLPTEQWSSWTGRKDSQKNVGGLHRLLSSPTPRLGGTSHDEA